MRSSALGAKTHAEMHYWALKHTYMPAWEQTKHVYVFSWEPNKLTCPLESQNTYLSALGAKIHADVPS